MTGVEGRKDWRRENEIGSERERRMREQKLLGDRRDKKAAHIKKGKPRKTEKI